MKNVIFIALVMLIGCGTRIEYPVVISTKNIYSDSECLYHVKSRQFDNFIFAPCDFANVGDTLK